ncbi:MAG: hypothetical protein GEV05_25685 [Betaproteobacteria bacterium]|nr:hypothetical protein [Betaproteobacteria bacterium]
MPMTVTIDAGDAAGYLHAVVRGEFYLEEAQRTFLEVLEVVVRDRFLRVLLEGVAITGEPTTIERFYYAKFAAAAVALSTDQDATVSPRFAYVLKRPVLDPLRFGENVAVNRGMNIKAFEDLEAARRWLGLLREN